MRYYFSNFSKSIYFILHHAIHYPTPNNINYAWSFGGLVMFVMIIQILTGIFLAMHYSSDITLAFVSVEYHIMRDVNNGWLIRYAHANGASVIFALMYLHIGRTLYYKTYNPPRHWLWISGVFIFFLTMATAFLGYVLPWGQMSFWGATVITNLFTTIPIIGNKAAIWIWGGFSVSNSTLVRFFALHYLIPFLILGLIFIHLALLHENGSTNSIEEKQGQTIDFGPYLLIKDLFVFILFLIFYSILIFYYPNLLGHPDNAIPANPLSTPKHIVPEWYFLPFYAILKSVPNKSLGVLLMGLSILMFIFFCDLNINSSILITKNSLAYFWYRFLFWLIISNFFLLGWVGSMPAKSPYTDIAGFLTFFYGFFFVLYMLPVPAFFLNYLIAWHTSDEFTWLDRFLVTLFVFLFTILFF